MRYAALLIVLSSAISALPQQSSPTPWQFAASGDSRNCGDVVVPAIAESVLKSRAEFYWHLGDFRALYGVDEDMQARFGPHLGLEEYRRIAWGDFLSNQVAAFGVLPVRLGIGNHETIKKTPEDFATTFGYWMDLPEIRSQRPAADIQAGTLRSYYHWKQHQVDFIYLDNSSSNGFDDAQIQWFESILAQDKTDNEVRTVVLGMHRALPNSLACGHSMNGDPGSESAQSLNGGRQVFTDLTKFREDTSKFVYILASHSHFYMENIFETKYWQNRKEKNGDDVLPGWIVGTAGAMRYNLPDLSPDVLKSTKARTDVSGYLLGTVEKNGSIKFSFKEVSKAQVPDRVRERYNEEFVEGCFIKNHDSTPHPLAKSCSDE